MCVSVCVSVCVWVHARIYGSANELRHRMRFASVATTPITICIICGLCRFPENQRISSHFPNEKCLQTQTTSTRFTLHHIWTTSTKLTHWFWRRKNKKKKTKTFWCFLPSKSICPVLCGANGFLLSALFMPHFVMLLRMFRQWSKDSATRTRLYTYVCASL